MEFTIVIIYGLVTLFGLVITVRCVQAQKRILWLAPSSEPVLHNVKIIVNIPIYFFGVAKLLATPGLEDPDSTQAVASGALMLIKTPVFQDIDGFQGVKGEMFDDVGLATYGIQYASFFTVRRILRFHPLKLQLFPLVAVVGTCCLGRALYYHRKGEVSWRGRTIKVKEKGAG